MLELCFPFITLGRKHTDNIRSIRKIKNYQTDTVELEAISSATVSLLEYTTAETQLVLNGEARALHNFSTIVVVKELISNDIICDSCPASVSGMRVFTYLRGHVCGVVWSADFPLLPEV